MCVLCVHSLKHSFSLHQMSREESAQSQRAEQRGEEEEEHVQNKREQRQKWTLQIFRSWRGIQWKLAVWARKGIKVHYNTAEERKNRFTDTKHAPFSRAERGEWPCFIVFIPLKFFFGSFTHSHRRQNEHEELIHLLLNPLLIKCPEKNVSERSCLGRQRGGGFIDKQKSFIPKFTNPQFGWTIPRKTDLMTHCFVSNTITCFGITPPKKRQNRICK